MRPQRCALVLLATAALAVPPALQSGQPTLTTIVLDGSFEDWQTVFANPFNTVFDGDGHSIPCADSSDRDCIVSSASSDLAAFAFTWDNQNLYLYVRRFGTANNKMFNLYMDTVDDGFLDAPDHVLQHLFKATQGLVEPTLADYTMSNGTPDPIVDALGFGDGYTVPGGPGNTFNNPWIPGDCTTCASLDGLEFEFAWPWQAMGMTPGQAFQYHLAATGSSGTGADDNLAGRRGLGGSTAYYLHEITGATVTSAAPQTSLLIPHEVTVTGNKADVVDLRVVSGLGLEVCLHTDPNRDGQPDALLACDRKGNGTFSDSNDLLAPGADSDGDGLPDTDLLSRDTSFPLILEVFLTNQVNRRTETLELDALSSGDPTVTAQAKSLISVGQVAVYPERELAATPDVELRLAHNITNHLPSSETFDLTATTVRGWTYQLWSDPDGDGDPSDGVQLFDSNGDTRPDVTLAAGTTFPFVAVTQVPISAPIGVTEEVTFTASSNGSVNDDVLDRILVSEAVSLTPDHLQSNGLGKAGSADYPVFYRHTLRWAGTEPRVFDLFGLSSQGFQVDFFTDPNGDGNPSDGQLLPEPVSTPTLNAFGGSFTFLVRVSIPPSASPGTLDTLDLFAVGQSPQAETGEATDETRVTLIQIFKEASLTTSLTHLPACSTVWARATGLVASQTNRYRIRWDDPSGMAVQIQPFASDVNGEGFDTYDFPPDSPLGLWSIAIQEDQGGAWVDMDRWFFEVENPGTLDLLETDQPSYMVLDDTVAVSARFRNNGQADLGPLTIRFRILTPDSSSILLSDGTYVPFTGSEDTWSSLTGPIPAGVSEDLFFGIGAVQWEKTGFQVLEVLWDNECGTTIASTSETFLLDPDFDGDGAEDLDELNGGLDVLDRDTDDDGLLDGTDGTTDTDGDTVVDGLSCDADGDGLADGLEAGVTAATADADTDTASPCFVEDADAGATTTDPFVADTDGGGLDDGTEDSNSNGRVDSGEGDPNDPADDTCPNQTPVEVAGLRVARSGTDILLSWESHPDLCASYRITSSTTPEDGGSYQVVASGLATESWTHAGVAPEGSPLRAWLIRAVSPVAGDGVLGHFAE